MFFRWKKRKQPPTEYRGRRAQSALQLPTSESTYHSALMVESVRVDGKPKQRTVKYLGSIGELQIQSPLASDRSLFWAQVGQHLTELDLPEDQRREIEAKIEAKVPRPPEKEEPAPLEELAERINQVHRSVHKRQ